MGAVSASVHNHLDGAERVHCTCGPAAIITGARADIELEDGVMQGVQGRCVGPQELVGKVAKRLELEDLGQVKLDFDQQQTRRGKVEDAEHIVGVRQEPGFDLRCVGHTHTYAERGNSRSKWVGNW